MTKFLGKDFIKGLFLAVSLFILGALLNSSVKLAHCSIIFVLMMLNINIIAGLYGMRKAIKIALLCSSFNIAMGYFMGASNFNLTLLVVSFASVLVSGYYSSMVISAFSAWSFQFRNVVALMIAAIIDTFIVSSFLLTKFSASKVMYIFSKDLTFKSMYIIAISTCVYVVAHFLKNRQITSVRHI